ncbi:GABA permease, putative [Glarea lozoyensis ATCC 20868]|uniref:GABA permease, putative n=1 Tax=Glarea lozoyensis (strain ATCC 20868 / MF5171) TaxID=1116229 RepID=S3DLM6_GLAL2|nr:GABA permease, putative [Glarea lozoyensis ATCC 20868]EPE32956.1 GABA permease, putative [Glarea lozoyensis ATCC 20868]
MAPSMPNNYELEVVRSAKKGESISKITTRDLNVDRDNDDLIRLGKRPVLKRNFGFMSILGFSCTILITWEGTLILFLSGFQNGGPAGVVYGYLLVWIGTLSVFATLSELVSMAPTSGGQYHWVSMLAPPSCAKFLSYITGWLTGLIALTVPDYNPQAFHGTLTFWAVILFGVFVNTVVSNQLPKFEGLILILHVLGFFAVLIPLVVLAPHGNSSDVFTVFLNGGGWPNQELSFFVGLLGNVFAFIGADGAYHMSEEIHNPSIVVPRSIMLSVILNGMMGFAMVIAVLFCLGDIDTVLATNTGYPFMEIFIQATHSVAGSAVMAAIVTMLALCSTVGLLASTSRMFWSFARDRGLPGWKTLHKVNARTSVPIWSVAVTTVISCLLALINIGSATAFNNIVSLSIVGLFTSYLLAAGLLLFRRLTGFIKLASDSPTELVNTANATIVWGPWHIRGILGVVNNTFACSYLIVILFFSTWPPATPVVPSTMNYSSLMLGAVIIFSIAYYLIYARKEYQGPVLETEQPIYGS